MREYPIIMTADEIKNIMSGRKLQVRRPLPWRFNKLEEFEFVMPRGEDDAIEAVFPGLDGFFERIRCPWGTYGSPLWVRETWAARKKVAGSGEVVQTASAIPSDGKGWEPFYKCDQDSPKGIAWKSSSQMPRWASRIDLAVSVIEIERLQDITPEDACLEGTFILEEGKMDKDGTMHLAESPVDTFRKVWDSVYLGKDGFGDMWENNPWVWVITFEVTRKK